MSQAESADNDTFVEIPATDDAETDPFAEDEEWLPELDFDAPDQTAEEKTADEVFAENGFAWPEGDETDVNETSEGAVTEVDPAEVAGPFEN